MVTCTKAAAPSSSKEGRREQRATNGGSHTLQSEQNSVIWNHSNQQHKEDEVMHLIWQQEPLDSTKHIPCSHTARASLQKRGCLVPPCSCWQGWDACILVPACAIFCLNQVRNYSESEEREQQTQPRAPYHQIWVNTDLRKRACKKGCGCAGKRRGSSQKLTSSALFALEENSGLITKWNNRCW